MSEIDLFGDLMDVDHAGYGALDPIMRPSKAVESVPEGKMPNGVVFTYHCPVCAKEGRLLYSWAELYIIANGIHPQAAVGIKDAWQADSEFPTAFGFATHCRACNNQQAPIMVGIEEARQDLARNPYYKGHPDVVTVAPYVQRFLQSQRR